MLGIILNINSKVFRENPSEATVLKNIIDASGHRGTLLKITENDDQILSAADEFKSAGIETLGLIGGDGTLQSTLSHFIQVYGDSQLPRIAILRGGTNNTVATSLHISGSAKKLLRNLISQIKNGNKLKIVKRNLIKVNGAYGFIFGNGFFHNFLEIYHRRAYPSRIKGFLLLTRAAFSALTCSSMSRSIFSPFKTSITIDGEKLPSGEFSAISCSTVPHVGYGFKIYSKALCKEECFHLIGFPKNPRLIAASMPGLFFGKVPERRGFLSKTAKEVMFETDTPVGYQLDGENRVDSCKFTIRTGPRLQFIV